MNKIDKKYILILLIIILISALALIIKISTAPKYDEKLYETIYQEYNALFEKTDIENTQDDEKNPEQVSKNNETIYMQRAVDGTLYRVIASITIPKIGISYPVISETTDEYLKIAPCKYWGGELNELGNVTIIGHNYNSDQFFSHVKDLNKGDKIVLKSVSGKELTYKVLDIYEIANDDFSCTETATDGTIDLTLITCTNKNSRMYVAKCRAEI